MKLLSVLVLLVQCIAVFSQWGARCVTPNGESALCLSIYNCPPLLQSARDRYRTAEVSAFLQRSQCGYQNNAALVCCGRVGQPIQNNINTMRTTMRSNANGGRQNSRNDLLPERGVCGFQPIVNRILGGTDADLDEFTWMARLQYRKGGRSVGFQCAGSLISNRYVLTAAHCIVGQIRQDVGDLFRVRLGEYDVRTDTDCVVYQTYEDCAPPHVDYDIEEAIAHPQYADQGVRANDIGLIRLARQVAFTDFIKPICLPTQGETARAGQMVFVSGWGRTLTATNSAVKQKLNVTVQSQNTCNSVYQNLVQLTLTSEQLCAGGVENQDSCQGDSGGPMMSVVPGTNIWYQEGIISTGYGCGMRDVPGIYTRVSSFLNWIQNSMRP